MSQPVDPPAALAVGGVHFTYAARRGAPPHVALGGVDLVVRRGERIALLGPNGSGKSTLIRLVSAVLRPERGTIAVDGVEEPAEIRSRISVVFQSPGLDQRVTVRRNLLDQATLYGLPRSEAAARVGNALQRFDLADRADAVVGTLSGGLARRVDLCRALLHAPRLLLLDEPTTGLDPAARWRFLDEVEQRQRDDPDLAVLVSTHDAAVAERCHRVIMLDAGIIVADDAPEALRHQLGPARLTLSDALRSAAPADGRGWQHGRRGWWLAEVDAEVMSELTASGEGFTVGPPSLDDVFESLTGHRLADPPLTEVAS